jgi:SAM-dependent methyltransferase
MESGSYDSYRHHEWYDWLDFTAEVGRKHLKLSEKVVRHQLKVLSAISSGRRIIDVGAGIGIFAKIASQEGWEVICTDLNDRAKKFGTEIYGLHYRNLEDVPPASLDVVRLSHVLEHVSQPQTFLASVRRVLKPNGICVVLVPNYEPLSCVLKNFVFRRIPGQHDFRGHIYAPQHVLGFKPISLQRTFTLAGFRPVRIQSVSQGSRAYYRWKSDGVRLTLRQITYELLNNLGNAFGLGSWVVGYFQV